MKVLVTGGAGYIGSHTCKQLSKEGTEVIVFDDLSTGYEDFVKWGIFERGDLKNLQDITSVLKKHQPDGVIHFAAKAYVGESVENPLKYYRNNVMGTLNLLEAMVDANVKNIVVSSTCATYGIPNQLPINEEAPQMPINPYGVTKLMMEQMLKDFETAYNLNWVALRYFNACGGDFDGEIGERHDPETHLIPRILMAITGEISHLDVYGDDYPTPDGTCQRDFIHVIDLAIAHRKAIEYLIDGGKSDAFNLGTGTAYSIHQVIEAAESVTGKKVPIKMSSRRAGDPPILVADIEKSKRVLGWQAAHSQINDVITSAWLWYKTNNDVKIV